MSDPRKLAEEAKERAYPVRETQAMIDALADAVMRLVEALERYGVHETKCAMLDHPFDRKDCTCGLLASIEGDNP